MSIQCYIRHVEAGGGLCPVRCAVLAFACPSTSYHLLSLTSRVFVRLLVCYVSYVSCCVRDLFTMTSPTYKKNICGRELLEKAMQMQPGSFKEYGTKEDR